MDSQTKWETLSRTWMSVEPPAAPSEQDVSNYLSMIPPSSRTVAILGCTPLLRQKVRLLETRVFSLDISHGMLNRSTSQLPLSPNESQIQCNWMQIPLRYSSVDALLGDKVFDNVLPSEWPTWIAELSRVLTPGGVFITRIAPRGRLSLSVPSALPLEKAILKWSSMSETGGWSAESACAGLWEDLLAASTRPDSEHTGTQQTSRMLPRKLEELRQLWPERSREGQLIARFVDRYWESRYFTWSAYTMEGVIRALDPSFALSSALIASDYPEAIRQPVLAFSVRRLRQLRMSRRL